MPTALQFLSAMKSVLVNNLTTSQNLNKNCEDDSMELLVNIRRLLSQPIETGSNHNLEVDNEFINKCQNVALADDNFEKETAAYVVKTLTKCDFCIDCFMSKTVENFHLLISLKDAGKGAPLSEYSMFMSCIRTGYGLDVNENNENRQKVDLLPFKRLLTYRSWYSLGQIRNMTHKKLLTLEPKLLEFYNKYVAVTLDKSVVICAAKQGTPEWYLARQVRQTSSKPRSQYTYYVNKKANWDARYKEVFHSTWKGNKHTSRGLEDEISCRNKYKEINMCDILETGLLVRPEVPWLACSLDGTVLNESGEFIRNIEVKSFKEGSRFTASELVEMEIIPILDKNGNVKNNTHYAQMQLGMLISGLNECDYCIYSRVSEDYVCFRVFFNGTYVLDLCSTLDVDSENDDLYD
ncbi:hypothetical protein ABEB36_014580 [Hypothenemus hampei]|uniref:YqaJ viral recombinase domain-containing protein n=1 Tax=Hypothenemus hampei TaxID=57062 RepID=A0ABD1E282_HYPHA